MGEKDQHRNHRSVSVSSTAERGPNRRGDKAVRSRQTSVIRKVISTSLILGVLVSGASTTLVATAAFADTGNYPYWNMPCELFPYSTTGFCTAKTGPFDWGPTRNGSAASQNSPYGYAYRNCTDYAAWKVASLGVQPRQYQGLGDAKSWAVNAASHGLTANASPAVGSVAVSTSGTYGHVAFVTAVNGGTISVAQYNQPGDGTYTNAIGDGSFTRILRVRALREIRSCWPYVVNHSTELPSTAEHHSGGRNQSKHRSH
jgi:surface antigen